MAVVALAMTFTACKKDRTCTCTTTEVSSTVNGVSQPVSTTVNKEETKYSKTKKKAVDCNSGEETMSYSYTMSGTVYNIVDVNKVDCSLD